MAISAVRYSNRAWGLATVSARSKGRSSEIERWISDARHGSRSSLGHLLEACRPYLLLMANEELSPKLLAKAGASDLVQESFLEAQRDFERFQGTSEPELLAWLRRILLNNIATFGRLFRETGKRQLDREVALSDTALDQLLLALVDRGESPSSVVAGRERDGVLKQCLGRLPEQYRQVIRWRNYDRCSFEEIGDRMGRSAEAARKLWARAIEHLQQFLDSPHAS